MKNAIFCIKRIHSHHINWNCREGQHNTHQLAGLDWIGLPPLRLRDSPHKKRRIGTRKSELKWILSSTAFSAAQLDSSHLAFLFTSDMFWEGNGRGTSGITCAELLGGRGTNGNGKDVKFFVLINWN